MNIDTHIKIIQDANKRMILKHIKIQHISITTKKKTRKKSNISIDEGKNTKINHPILVPSHSLDSSINYISSTICITIKIDNGRQAMNLVSSHVQTNFKKQGSSRSCLLLFILLYSYLNSFFKSEALQIDLLQFAFIL